MTILLTPHLMIRPVESNDLHSIHSLHSLPETDKYNTLGIPQHISATQEILDNWIAENNKPQITSHTFVIELKETNDFVGMIAINLGKPKYKAAEIWFKLHPDYWQKGFATEAVKEIIRYGFEELQLHRIEAGCAVENVASARVLEKSGMKQEGRKRKALPLKSGWSDNFEYAIIAEE